MISNDLSYENIAHADLADRKELLRSLERELKIFAKGLQDEGPAQIAYALCVQMQQIGYDFSRQPSDDGLRFWSLSSSKSNCLGVLGLEMSATGEFTLEWISLSSILIDNVTSPQMVRQCLETGVEIDSPDDDGNTALIRCFTDEPHWAHPVALPLLLEAGADPNAVYFGSKYPDRSSALHIASIRGDWRAIELLLKAGADPHVTDSDSRTPIHAWAMDGGRHSADSESAFNSYLYSARSLFHLLKAGIDLNATDGEGQTALDLCGASPMDESDPFEGQCSLPQDRWSQLLVTMGARRGEEPHAGDAGPALDRIAAMPPELELELDRVRADATPRVTMGWVDDRIWNRPFCSRLYGVRAECLNQVGDFKNAEKEARIGLEFDPADALCHLQYAESTWRQAECGRGEYGRAVEQLTTAMDYSPSHGLLLKRGLARMRTGAYHSALEDLESCQPSGDYEELRRQALGVLHSKLGNDNEARELFATIGTPTQLMLTDVDPTCDVGFEAVAAFVEGGKNPFRNHEEDDKPTLSAETPIVIQPRETRTKFRIRRDH